MNAPTNSRIGSMANMHGAWDSFLHIVSTSRSRSAVTLAAVSFAVCHLVVMGSGSGPAGIAADLDVEIPRQLLHFAAVICRFALPLGFLVAGFAIRAKTAPIGS
jgi:hypothetical protein